MSESTHLILNGAAIDLADCEPTLSLLRWLRLQQLSGTKEGCADGDCGACSVTLVETDAQGRRTLRAVNSCLLPMGMLAGRELLTVEALADGNKLHPVQQAMVDCGGSQCGYCTPGFVMSLLAGQLSGELDDDCFEGNLCRCTGYQPIRAAAAQLRAQGDAFASAIAQPSASAEAPGAARIRDFHSPTTIEAALHLKSITPGAVWIAGATDLGVDLSHHKPRAPTYIALDRIAELQRLEIGADQLRIGAGVNLRRLETELAGIFPALDQMLPWFAARQVRNRATLGGNLGTASPIGDLLPVLLALDAVIVCRNLRGTREIAIADYFVGYRQTALAADELITEVRLPRRADLLNCSYKVAKRQTDDISIVAAAFALAFDADGRIEHIRLAYGGVAAVPLRAQAVEQLLLGQTLNAALIERACAALRECFRPLDDHRASADYRRALCANLFAAFAGTLAAPRVAEGTPAETKTDVPENITDHQCIHAAATAPRHESAVGHVSGRAIYTDEQHPPSAQLSLYPVQAPHAHARILRVDGSAALAMPGVHAVLTASDIPGRNNTGPILHDEPLIPTDEVSYHGQAVAWVVAQSEAQARRAALSVRVDYEPLPACLSIEQALARDSFHLPPAQVARGDAASALAAAPHRLEGELGIGGQDHFYLETQASWAQLDSEGLLQVCASTQHPSETQHIVAQVLGIPSNRVVCRSLRMGGGFGGKETQANPYAALAALAAVRCGRPVRVKLTRGLDMQLTGKRHPFHARYRIGYDAQGQILAAEVELIADGGWSCDLSPPVLMRAMVHVDNAYYLPNVRISGRIAKTHLPSNTAFRGFGGPQGMLVGEEIIDRVARALVLPPEQVRERNFYRPGQTPDRNTTHYGQPVVDNHLPQLWAQLKRDGDFDARSRAVADFNASHSQRKRGLAITPVKFGISFNKTEYNQAGALVHIYTDGSVQLNHGGTEMGQGLHSKMIAVAAATLGVRPERIQIMVTSTDKVPNTSATAASSGSDLNGQAVKAACETLRNRLAQVAADRLRVATDRLIFTDGQVDVIDAPAPGLSFDEVVQAAYNQRISLSATGYYRTPGLHWDAASGQGHPFYYYAFGAALSEVEVCGLTGMHRLLRVDLLHDVGDSLNESIDRGQIEGGFVQGLGWLTCEELRWSVDGRLLTDAPSTYKIPTVGEVPQDFRVQLFRRADQSSRQVIGGSKAVGEPPLMLALSVREALRAAVAAFADAPPKRVDLACPATPESVWRAVTAVMGPSGER
jgi:xanthine dehydrogenase molybdopterin binding subunit/xanthine dehydrogenase small subunit